LCKKQEDGDWSKEQHGFKDPRIHHRVSNSSHDTIPNSLLSRRQEQQPNQREPSQLKNGEKERGLDQETELRIQLPTEDDKKKKKKKPNPYFS
jgi:hypothetical protein